MKSPYLILVTGSRERSDLDATEIAGDLLASFCVAEEMGRSPVVVTGDCPTGADDIAKETAISSGVTVVNIPANWRYYGKTAGPIRNSAIAALFEFDEVLSYPGPNSKGTHDMIRKARMRR